MVWKVRRKCDGLFSTGSTEPRFNARGKVWRRHSDVVNHLQQFGQSKGIYASKRYNNDILVRIEDVEVVCFVLVERECVVEQASDIVAAAKKRASLRERESRERYVSHALERNRKEHEAILAEQARFADR